MKRLLGAGFERIYQLVRCFRNGETSPRHNPEFTMLEWYRAYASYVEVMRDVEDLVRAVVAGVRGAPVATLAGGMIDLGGPWPRLSVAEAFRRHAGVELRGCLDRDGLHRAAATAGCRSVTATDTWEDAFRDYPRCEEDDDGNLTGNLEPQGNECEPAESLCGCGR